MGLSTEQWRLAIGQISQLPLGTKLDGGSVIFLGGSLVVYYRANNIIVEDLMANVPSSNAPKESPQTPEGPAPVTESVLTVREQIRDSQGVS